MVTLKITSIFAPVIAKVAQLVEHNLAKVRVAGSSPVFRSKSSMRLPFVCVEEARVAELVDALVSGTSVSNYVQVRVLFRAPLLCAGGGIGRHATLRG